MNGKWFTVVESGYLFIYEFQNLITRPEQKDECYKFHFENVEESYLLHGTIRNLWFL